MKHPPRNPKTKSNNGSGQTKIPAKKNPWPAIGAYGLPAALFIFFFVYIWWYIDPRVIYSCNGIDVYSYVHYVEAGAPSKLDNATFERRGRHRYILELTSDYFTGVFSKPGGPARLLTTLTCYACHDRFLGACALTFLAWLLFFLFSLFLRQCHGSSGGVLRYLPPLFLLVVCGWYELIYLAYIIPVIGGL